MALRERKVNETNSSKKNEKRRPGRTLLAKQQRRLRSTAAPFVLVYPVARDRSGSRLLREWLEEAKEEGSVYDYERPQRCKPRTRGDLPVHPKQTGEEKTGREEVSYISPHELAAAGKRDVPPVSRSWIDQPTTLLPRRYRANSVVAMGAPV